MLEIEKQGTNDYGVWVIGKLVIGNLEIKDLFNTNLKNEIDDTSKPIKISKVKISRNYESKQLRFKIEF